jgi:hypothetical protein
MVTRVARMVPFLFQNLTVCWDPAGFVMSNAQVPMKTIGTIKALSHALRPVYGTTSYATGPPHTAQMIRPGHANVNAARARPSRAISTNILDSRARVLVI